MVQTINPPRYMRFVLISVLAIAMAAVSCRPTEPPQEVSKYEIRTCQWAECTFSNRTGVSVSTYIRTNELAGFTMAQIFNEMLGHIDRWPESVKEMLNDDQTTNIGPIVDGWGRPLNFEWYEEAAKQDVDAKLFLPRLPILVWSSGENGVNEFGRGDDIIVTNPIPESK
jgi:hypothetical protein